MAPRTTDLTLSKHKAVIRIAMVIVSMGVSGAGNPTVGKLLALTKYAGNRGRHTHYIKYTIVALNIHSAGEVWIELRLAYQTAWWPG